MKDKHKDNQKDTMAHLISTMSSSKPSALCCKLEENRFQYIFIQINTRYLELGSFKNNITEHNGHGS